ncbi:MAG: FAD-dependent oxidoreductase [Geminicoccaceae bacterium]
MSDSYYLAHAPKVPTRRALAGTVETETAIVGGGLAGLGTALSLAERGRPSVLLEARQVGAGASGRNGGMVSAGFAASTRLLDHAVGPIAAASLMGLSRDAMKLMRARIARHAIDCAPIAGVVIASWFDDAASLRAEVAEYNQRFGMRLEFWSRERLQADYPSPRYWDGMFDPEGFHLDPLALTRGYAAAAESLGARLFEDSPATRLERSGGRWRITSPHGTLVAERVVLCQSAYAPRLVPTVARATLPVFTYVIVTEPLTGRHAGVIRAPYAVYDNRFATGYYRLLPDRRLLWGGRISTRERPRDLAAQMQRDLALVYPQLAGVAVEHAWSGRMGFARHKMPLIRELAPGLWVNSCFGGHGLNTTTLGGELVASALTEGDRRWKLLAPFGPRWVGGAFGPLAAQAIYGHSRLQDATRAFLHHRRARRRRKHALLA